MNTTLGKTSFPTIGIPHSGATLSTSCEDIRISAARFQSPRLDRLCVQPQDAFVAKMQVLDAQSDAETPAGFSILDLKNGASCYRGCAFHELYVHVPQSALDAITREANAARICSLRTPAGWNTGDPIVQHIQNCLIATTERPDTVSQLFVDYTLIALVAHLAQTYGGMREQERRRSGGLAAWQERRAREMIASNLAKDISLDQIAIECKLSAPHFARAFKRSTGLTPHAWLQECRVEHAKSLLPNPNLSLAAIAIACGFADQSHFTKVFSRKTGSTPGRWRRFVSTPQPSSND